MNTDKRSVWERPNADHHINFGPYHGRVVTITYHSDTAPGNCGILAGTLETIDGWLYVSTNRHAGATVPVERVVRIEFRDPALPQFV